jgi:serine/threonine protein kinase
VCFGGLWKSRPGQPRGWEQAVRYLLEVGDALCAVHARGLVHGDITPANILRREADHRVLLTDSGRCGAALPQGVRVLRLGGSHRGAQARADATAAGSRLFQDLLHLEPGQRWERELYRHIDECDVFFLFWSHAAEQSVWVHEELRYALARQGGNDLADPRIIPVPLDTPIKPLAELSHVHFGD